MSDSWTFVTSHTLVLLCIAEDPEIRMSDVAARVGITERRVQAIVAQLVASGHLTKAKRGRRNHYEINSDMPLRHLETEHRQLGELLSMLEATGGQRGGQPARASGTTTSTASGMPIDSDVPRPATR